jgi:glycosyltransferase involved in cell wall biosynthesis
MQLTGIVIAKDEEKKIGDCLKSLSFCDEILVIDSGSTDGTVKMAEKHNAKIFHHDTADFAELRNFGLEKATGEWVLYIDADERVTPSLKENIQFQISQPEADQPLADNFPPKRDPALQDEYPIVAFKVQRKNFYFGHHEWPFVEKLERLFKKDSLIEWYGSLHESPKVKGQIGELDGLLLHYSHQDLTSMVAKTNEWSDVEARIRFEQHHPKMTWWRFPRVMLSAFWNSYIMQGGWRAGTAGVVESIFQAYSMFITYAKLWELQDEKSRK